MLSRGLLWIAVCGALFWTNAALAQPYPSRPITLVVPYAAGSGIDILARKSDGQSRQRLGQPVIVDDKPGAGSVIGSEFVAKSAPDGYTLMYTSNLLPVLPAIYKMFRSIPWPTSRTFPNSLLAVWRCW